MQGKYGFWLAMVMSCLIVPAARADIYSASQAYDQKDYPKAFEQFQELAELGNLQAQEAIAVMYVNGDGIKRDNIQGYAWASIAVDNGGGEPALGIISQLEPHMTASARSKVDAIKAQFGGEALKKALLPNILSNANYADREPCRMTKPNAGFYPQVAQDKGAQGEAYVEFTVMPDGRARNPRVVYAVPTGYFEEPSRVAILKSEFSPALGKQGLMPCTMAVMFRYQMDYAVSDYNKLDAFQVAIANYLLRGSPTAEDAAKARTWLERAVSHGSRDGKFYLAALLAAGPDEHSRDPARSLELLKGAMREMDQDPTSFEIRAAANAALGKFKDAKKDQAKALRMATGLGWDVFPQKSRLAQYQDNQTFTGDLFAF